MNLSMNITTALLSIIVLTVPTSLRANDLDACTKRLRDCESLVWQGNKVIVDQQILIGLQADQISDLKFNYNIVKSRLNEVTEEKNAWYRNPMIIVPLSFVAGAVVFSQVSK
jgi:hypothetical protein